MTFQPFKCTLPEVLVHDLLIQSTLLYAIFNNAAVEHLLYHTPGIRGYPGLATAPYLLLAHCRHVGGGQDGFSHPFQGP